MPSTNYYNTLIEIAEDCLAVTGEIPPANRDRKIVANLQFEMLQDHPYQYTSDDVLFSVFAKRNNLLADELEEQRAIFFSRGQPCFRSSPLTKRYGWGIHSNASGKIAMFAVESAEYKRLVADDTITKKKAMRSKRA